MSEFKKWNEVVKEGPVSLIVTEPQMKEVLEITGNKTNKEGIIVDKKNNPEEANDSSPIKLKELGGICSGSKVFIRKNLAAFSHYLTTKEK